MAVLYALLIGAYQVFLAKHLLSAAAITPFLYYVAVIRVFVKSRHNCENPNDPFVSVVYIHPKSIYVHHLSISNSVNDYVMILISYKLSVFSVSSTFCLYLFFCVSMTISERFCDIQTGYYVICLLVTSLGHFMHHPCNDVCFCNHRTFLTCLHEIPNQKELKGHVQYFQYSA